MCAVLVSAAFASPALTDAESAISSLSHPHGAQYAFRLSDFAAAESVGEFHHIPVNVGKVAYTCRVPIDSFPAQSPPKEHVPTVAQTDPESELKAVLRSLKGTCLRSQLGYWTYEICLGQSVKQFHVEGSAITVQYSLGNYARSVYKKSGESGSNSVPVLEIFNGGTNCDETGSGRNSVVGYVCGVGDLALTDVKEHEVCGYKMVISSRAFCSRPSSSDPAATQASSGDLLSGTSAVTMRSIINELGSGCYTLADGWWTYQLCPGISMKQFHATPAGSVDPATEYSLGVFNASASDQEPAAPKHRLPVVYREEYSQGTQCDVGSKQHRSTIVTYECDVDSAPTLVQVREISPCVYTAIFRSASVCKHPAFMPAAAPVVPVDCWLS